MSNKQQWQLWLARGQWPRTTVSLQWQNSLLSIVFNVMSSLTFLYSGYSGLFSLFFLDFPYIYILVLFIPTFPHPVGTCSHLYLFSALGQCPEGAGGELAGVRRAAALGGAEPSGAGWGDRHTAARGWASCPGASPRFGEWTQPTEAQEQRAGGLRTDPGQSGLPAGSEGVQVMPRTQWQLCWLSY